MNNSSKSSILCFLDFYKSNSLINICTEGMLIYFIFRFPQRSFPRNFSSNFNYLSKIFTNEQNDL